MKIYEITADGARAARNIHNPSSGAYRVLNYLAKVGKATTEQVQNGTRLDDVDLRVSLSALRKNNLIVRG